MLLPLFHKPSRTALLEGVIPYMYLAGKWILKFNAKKGAFITKFLK